MCENQSFCDYSVETIFISGEDAEVAKLAKIECENFKKIKKGENNGSKH